MSDVSQPNLTCPICRHIPAHKAVETLHTQDRLPPEVTQLDVIGGHALYGREEVRRCPQCGTYYAFIHDHDSESGVGYGYTDEVITRLTATEAVVLIEKTIGQMQQSLRYWRRRETEGARAAPQFVSRGERALVRLRAELGRIARG